MSPEQLLLELVSLGVHAAKAAWAENDEARAMAAAERAARIRAERLILDKLGDLTLAAKHAAQQKLGGK